MATSPRVTACGHLLRHRHRLHHRPCFHLGQRPFLRLLLRHRRHRHPCLLRRGCFATKPTRGRIRTRTSNCPIANRPSGGTTGHGPTRRCRTHNGMRSRNCCNILLLKSKHSFFLTKHLLRVVIAQVATVPVAVPLPLSYQLVPVAVVPVPITVTVTVPLAHLHGPLRTQSMGKRQG